MSDHPVYRIPARFRRIENLHIFLWLLKDICWALDFRIMGMLMIVPALTVAFTITWQTRRITSELMHNLAVILWIAANSLWMAGEFYGFDEGTWGSRHLALIPFGAGLLILIYYYIILAPGKKFREKGLRQAEELVREENLKI
ncbi:MAG: hypothetical protein KIT80_08565 [Chitinophagaceae bacterium]|nr:hypothetical protein [Chitinophagaceae bacterium]MCW5926948.1 hypothetical protein [Chitinophagaceae bacterium]